MAVRVFRARRSLRAAALADDERAALAAGADFFLRKPFDERELLERIASALKVRLEDPALEVLPG
jgi:DNA-binding response OmpR family regulator